MIRRPPRSTRITHSFPTRRSSDLTYDGMSNIASHFLDLELIMRCNHSVGAGRRSEEHTSELQSPMRSSYAVFCLNKKSFFGNIYTIAINTLTQTSTRRHSTQFKYTRHIFFHQTHRHRSATI